MSSEIKQKTITPATLLDTTLATKNITENFLNLFIETAITQQPNLQQEKPAREIDLNKADPFQIGIKKEEIQSLTTEKKDQIPTGFTDNVIPSNIYEEEERNNKTNEWIEEIVYGEIKGFKNSFKKDILHEGSYKTGYVDKERQTFVQVPKSGETFEDKLKRVKTWEKNKKTLDQADKYVNQILKKEGTKKAQKNETTVDIDYDFLNNNEEILREEVEDGILTPSENYNIIITHKENEPIPVLVGDYNSEMLKSTRDSPNSREVHKRKKVIGMYMDALIEEGEFEGEISDFWIDNGFGREGTRNMFYCREKDKLGVVDLGEYKGTTPEEIPDLTIPEAYQKR